MEVNQERLKGSVTLKRTTNLGNFSSLTVEVSLQFFQDKDSLVEVLDALDYDILKWLEVRGIKNEVKALPK